MSEPRVAIVGGGIAGLGAAWECHRQGVPVTVLDAQPRVGGVIRTDVVGPFVLDTGPDGFLVTKPGAIDLCRELGIEHELITMRHPRGAWVLSRDRLRALPEGGAFGIPIRMAALLGSELLSPAGRLRVALEPLVPRRRQQDDESAAAFFRRRFGAEATRRIAQPLLGGIHVGDLDRLSAAAVLPQLTAIERAGRSVLLALRSQARRSADDGPFRSFPGGMETLVQRLVERLPSDALRPGRAVGACSPRAGAWELQATDGTVIHADLVLLAVPAGAAAGLLRPLDPVAADAAGSIRYLSSAGVLAVYDKRAIAQPLRGSGYVSVPEPGRDRLVATSWLTGKWDGRAPEGYTVLRGFLGGAFDETVLGRPDAALVAEAHGAWSRRFDITAPPELTRVVRWDRASPQHDVGHAARVSAIDDRLAARPGLAVAGSGFRAIGIPDVITDARTTMRGLLDRWRAR